MRGTLGLALYRLSARRKPRPQGPAPARPRGRLAWLHSPTAESRPAMLELARQLIEEDGIAVLLTASDPAASGEAEDGRTEAIATSPPSERTDEIRGFLDHWRPEIAVMAEGELRPILLDELARRDIPRLLVDGISPRFAPGITGWFPGLAAHSLDFFAQILVRDEAAHRAFRKSGAPGDRLRQAGPMEEASAALPCAESELQELAEALAARPVWLAADLPEAEEAMVIEAHREARKLAHRLLLILAPADRSRTSALAHRLEAEEGWRIACGLNDEAPDAETEIYLVEGGEDFGLWYRLAPVTYLGGGLGGGIGGGGLGGGIGGGAVGGGRGGCRRDPMEAASLGSALILGPHEGHWRHAYGRLTRAMAARVIASSAGLTQALADLLSPERAARQAQAAWTVVTEGAETTAEVIEMVRALMDGEPWPRRAHPPTLAARTQAA